MNRVLKSDVLAGTYLILVAEGLKNASGEECYDESAGVDAFGHKKLAGACKFVQQELDKRFKADPSITEFMKTTKMYVKGIYEKPEVRTVSPGHLVRCGRSSVYDVNFGKEAGASAVVLLSKGLSGYTIVGLKHEKIEYVQAKKAIEQRHVNPKVISFYEKLGVCFGRQPDNILPETEEFTGYIERYL